jgi:hypothetical protein
MLELYGLMDAEATAARNKAARGCCLSTQYRDRCHRKLRSWKCMNAIGRMSWDGPEPDVPDQG